MASEVGTSPRVERALFSVDDKTGLAEFARGLAELRVELWATQGTRRSLTEAGVPVGAAEELTGIADWFGGRIKTLHPALLGGILAPRTDAGRREMHERGLRPFDLVAVNLYPFERHLAEHPDATDREEYIDIGGVTLARAAAKNHAWVTVLTAPADYPAVLEELRANGGRTNAETRQRLADAAFRRTAAYDAAIARALGPAPAPSEAFPETVAFQREALQLRYGENPHQRAALYRQVDPAGMGFAPRPFRVLKGDALSYTNLLDVDTALAIVAEFPTPTAAIVKHATPCGVASGATIREALERAIATDPVARYGCAVAVNRPIATDDPEALKGVFVDLLAAPTFAAGALEALGRPAEGQGRGDRTALPLDPGVGGEERLRPAPPPGGGPPGARPGRLQARDRKDGDPRGGVRARFRLAGRAAREVERDRPRPGVEDGRDRVRPADAGEGRGARVRGRGRPVARRRARLGRVLPVRGRGRGRRPRRSDGDHPTRR